jgi:hypothetical protein
VFKTSLSRPETVGPKRCSQSACPNVTRTKAKARGLRAQRRNCLVTNWDAAQVCIDSVKNCKMTLHKSSGNTNHGFGRLNMCWKKGEVKICARGKDMSTAGAKKNKHLMFFLVQTANRLKK